LDAVVGLVGSRSGGWKPRARVGDYGLRPPGRPVVGDGAGVAVPGRGVGIRNWPLGAGSEARGSEAGVRATLPAVLALA